MKIKTGVDLDGISTNITKTWHVIEPILAQYGQELVVTSGLDGKHKANSKHYSGNACDLRTWTLQYADVCVKEMSAALGKDFDVVLESDHIHYEYDPK